MSPWWSRLRKLGLEIPVNKGVFGVLSYEFRRRFSVTWSFLLRLPPNEVWMLEDRPTRAGQRALGGSVGAPYGAPMPNIGPTEIIVVLVIALLVLGPSKLPSLGRGLGTGMREFKSSINGELPPAPAPVTAPVAADERTHEPRA